MSNIFNNIKVLTGLEAKNGATIENGMVVSGSYSGSTGLRVKENAIIDGQLTVGGNVVNQGYAQIGALVVDGVTDLSGNLYLTGSQYVTGDINANGNFTVSGITTLNGILSGALDVEISGNISASGDISASSGHYTDLYVANYLKISGSSNFDNILISRDNNGLYDVDAAIHALDEKINTSDSNYAKMRFFKTGSLNGSTVTLNLLSEGADSTFFDINQINYLVADVMIRINNTEAWTNDLTSVQIYNNEGIISVDLDVPAAESGWEYRMIIVNENGEMFI